MGNSLNLDELKRLSRPALQHLAIRSARRSLLLTSKLTETPASELQFLEAVLLLLESGQRGDLLKKPVDKLRAMLNPDFLV